MSERWSNAVQSRTPSPPCTDVLMEKEEIDDEPSRSPSPATNGAANSENGSHVKSEEGAENYDINLRKRKCSTASSSSSDSKKPLTKIESDPLVLARRQKDIDYGRNTIGYDNYIKQVPKAERLDMHPRTPPMYKKMSRRNWDATVKKWRVLLHNWDPEDAKKPANLKKATDSVNEEKKSTDAEGKVQINIESDSMKESQENSKMILEEPMNSENDSEIKL